MLKTPSSLQTCSSSPMRSRLGSADSVVLPVPDKPNSRDERPDFRSAVAEQCMDRSPRFGAKELGTVNTPFFISPAYSVPRMISSRSSRLKQMLVLESTPVVKRLEGNAPALQMTKSGLPNDCNSSFVGRISIVCMKSA